jgi:hypothetical protein
MFDLDEEDLYFPNTKVIRDLLESLNYKVVPIDTRVRRKDSDYSAICFSAWITQFDQIKQTNKMYYCMDGPTLTEEQSILVFDILHVCPDYQTFKEALEQYIESNP